jgi:hypothetical protein
MCLERPISQAPKRDSSRKSQARKWDSFLDLPGGGEGACGMVNLSIPQNSPLLPSPLGINGIKKKKKLKHRSSDIVGRASSSLALQKASKRNSIFMHRILILLLP